jgi:ketosteroid isomerase-like protein
VKSVGASKGNLADANEAAWSSSARFLKEKFPIIKTVVPGHGKYGGKELIDYTTTLFRPAPILMNSNGEKIDYKNHPGTDGEVIFDVVASERKGYSYEIKDHINESSSIIIKQDGHVKFEFLAERSSGIADTLEIDKRRMEWMEICNQNDASKLVERLYSKDAIYYNHKPLVVGRQAIISDYQYMNNPAYSLRLEPLVVHSISKDMVFEIGQCSGSYGGKYILVWRKDNDGIWRVFLDSNI